MKRIVGFLLLAALSAAWAMPVRAQEMSGGEYARWSQKQQKHQQKMDKKAAKQGKKTKKKEEKAQRKAERKAAKKQQKLVRNYDKTQP